MEKKRIVLIVILAILAIFIHRSWTEYASTIKPKTSQVEQSENTVQVTKNVDSSAASQTQAQDNYIDKKNNDSSIKLNKNGQIIEVKTDVLDVNINTQGGTLTKAALLKYKIKQGGQAPVVLFNNLSGTQYLAQSQLISNNNSFNDANVVYNSTKSYYQLADGKEKLIVNLTYSQKNNLKIVKSYTFTRGDYDVKVGYTIKNNGNSVWQGSINHLISRTDNVPPSKGLFHINSYTGASVSDQDSPYKKISFKNMSKNDYSETSQGGWIAMQQHYFLTAWIPDVKQNNHFFSNFSDNTGLYTIGVSSPGIQVNPGQLSSYDAQIYIGPELSDNLKALAPHLELTIDYGWLWFISEAIFWLMKHIYAVIGNWGWAIVIVTILIKAAFFHLSATSYRSMAKMRKLQPKLQSLKDKYGEDKQKLAQATMELYRKEKANPMSGCLPIIVQIPVFIALYWVLIESVQLRHAPFIFWIHDLSSADPYYILPILNGLAMFVQQKLNPPPPDPTQAKIMAFLPVVFTFLFMNFPSGLVLYWVVNSGISILQQWFIMNREDKKASIKTY